MSTIIVLVAMVAAFVLASIFLKSPEISLAITAVVGLLFGCGFGWTNSFPRVLVEGLFVNLDTALIFITASVFVNFYAKSGALDTITRGLVSKVNNKWILLAAMGALMLIPGALTGAGSVSIFVMGSLVGTIVSAMGVSKKKTTAFIFVFAILSAACPPVNLWVMLMCAQANMPYTGFELLLLLPIVVVSIFTIIYLGWGAKPKAKEELLAEIPEASAKLNGFGGLIRMLIPIIVLIFLFAAGLILPYDLPIIGLPGIFLCSAIAAIICNPEKMSIKKYIKLFSDTVEQVFPLMATVLSVGIMQNAMAASGVKGLIGTAFVLLPVVWIYVTALFFAPFGQGCMSYGSAVVIGTPLIFMFNTAGFDTTVVCAAMSLMFPIGDCLPPSRIVGRLAIENTGYEGSYMSFLKSILLPCLLLGLIALFMLIKPGLFSFLH